jgi:hypothetical protein
MEHDTCGTFLEINSIRVLDNTCKQRVKVPELNFELN